MVKFIREVSDREMYLPIFSAEQFLSPLLLAETRQMHYFSGIGCGDVNFC